jgi:hypothetical protein
MYAEFRLSHNYPNNSVSKSNLLTQENRKREISSPALSRGATVSTEANKNQEGTVFLNRNVAQTETDSLTKRVLNSSYRNSNRAAVALGLAGGVLGGVHGGAQGAMFAMSVGSSFGTHLGALTGAIGECSSSSEASEVTSASSQPQSHDIAESNHFLGRVIQVVDHAGHHAAVGSIGVGVATLFGSLVAGNSLPVVFHVAGVYSGATWAFGLTTGTTQWILQHLERSQDQFQRDQRSSLGDIELTPVAAKNRNNENEVSGEVPIMNLEGLED